MGRSSRRRRSASAGLPSFRAEEAGDELGPDLRVVALRVDRELRDALEQLARRLGVAADHRRPHGQREVLAAHGVVVVELGSLLVALHGLGVLAQALVGHAEVLVGRREVGLDRQGAVQVLDRLVVAARVRLVLAEGVEGVGVVGRNELVLGQVVDRPVIVAAVAVVVADLVVRLGVVRVDGQQLLEDLDGLVGVSLRELFAREDHRAAHVVRILRVHLARPGQHLVAVLLHVGEGDVHGQALPLGQAATSRARPA